MITCPSCNHQNEVGSSFCENCGHDLREMVPAPPPPPVPEAIGGAACSSCGQSNIPGAAFCENCGTKLGQVVPPVVPESVQEPAPSASAIQLTCTNCGNENIPGSVFCETCGSQLSQIVPGSETAEQQQASIDSHAEESPSEDNLCLQCGSPNPEGTLYCGNCGNKIGQAPVTPESEPTAEQTPPQAPQTDHLIGRLIIQDSGATIEIPSGLTEASIGREDPISGIFPEIDLDPHGGHDGGVGRRHAKLFLQGPQLMIEDLDSVNGTLVNKQKLSPNQPYPVPDGAELRFGKIVTIYNAN